ncbi:MAG: 2-oxoacid:ferredoxin oxidoreductase subunit beta [Balneolaceae bacterium]|nr:2-oxoacid:ferredoxin oxidoreductase subunit beta [Balneolaceae bacterium]
MPKMGNNLAQYLRTESMPSMWCPGCGHGNILRGILSAFQQIDLDLDQTVVVGGIGCSGRTPFYTDTHSMHTTHGRALAFGTGIKLANPELSVIAVMGDGDTAAIGGNHFIHACRRNIDMTAVIFNNNIYGMTGGQTAPTTPESMKSTTARDGNPDRPFDIVELAKAAGATFIARTTTFDFVDLPSLIARAIEHKGFSVVEVLTQCPTYFGRLNKIGDAVEMLDYERDLTVPMMQITREELLEKMPIGVFREEIKPSYTEQYKQSID